VRVSHRGEDGEGGGETNRREARSLSGNGGAEVGGAGDGARWRSGGCARERRSTWARRRVVSKSDGGGAVGGQVG
jgi:hypothetical protein